MRQHSRVSWIAVLAIALLPVTTLAEPIAFEQAANVTGRGGIELGANASYAWGSFEQQGVGKTVDQSLFLVPLFVRLGASAVEAMVTVPYGNVKSNVDTNHGSVDFSGIRDVDVMLKFWLIQSEVLNGSIGASSTFPTANPTTYLGQGLSVNPFAALGLDFGVFRLNGNLGYRFNTTTHTDVDPVTNQRVTDISLQQGDGFDWAGGLEIPFAEIFSLHAELLGTTFGELRFDGDNLSDTSGSTMAFVPGFRLTALPLKAKVGVQIPVSNRNNNTAFSPRSDWTVLAGLSLQFSAGGPNTNQKKSGYAAAALGY